MANFLITTLIIPLLLFNNLICNSNIKNYSYKLSFRYYKEGQLLDYIQGDFRLISYSGMLFEFNTGASTITTVEGKSGKIYNEKSSDTLSIYVLHPEKRRYYEFDTFAFNNTLLKVGRFSEKPFGQKMSDTITSYTNDLSNELRDTTIWGRNLFYLKYNQLNKQEKDSVSWLLYFVRIPNFISLWHVNSGHNYQDPNYSMVGFSMFDVESNEQMVCSLDEMRVLTAKEENICRSMVNKIPKK
jgi:hypothetical protein